LNSCSEYCLGAIVVLCIGLEVLSFKDLMGSDHHFHIVRFLGVLFIIVVVVCCLVYGLNQCEIGLKDFNFVSK
jgi:hypothetical protein